MQAYISQWETRCDDRALFLSCYARMTRNVQEAVQRREFDDPEWIDRLLQRFAEYYFAALEAHEREAAPPVWQQAFAAAGDPEVLAIQKLLLGVNAHINYDLVFTLDDLLRPEWATLPATGRAARYADHCRVNDVISATIDAVQDEVIEPAMPLMSYLDVLLGPMDEYLISRLLTHWRERVWRYASQLLSASDAAARRDIRQEVERETLRTGHQIAQHLPRLRGPQRRDDLPPLP